MQGNQGQIGVALVPASGVAPTAPAISLRVRTFADPMPQFIETEDDIATGTRFGRQRFVQGVQAGNKTITATATLRDLPVLLQTILGTPDGTGLITPRANDFGALRPGQPLHVWQAHPLMNAEFPNSQVSSISINVTNRANAEVTVTLNTSVVTNPGTMPAFPAIATTNIGKFLNFFVTIAGVTVAPESATITIEQGMEAEDGAQGLDNAANMFVIGWAGNGPLVARVAFTVNESGAKFGANDLRTLVDLAKPNAQGERTTQAVTAGFKFGADEIRFNLPAAQIVADSIPNGLGRLSVGFTAEGTGLGTTPVTVNVPAPPPAV